MAFALNLGDVIQGIIDYGIAGSKNHMFLLLQASYPQMKAMTV